jgi:N6-adenosine-specific RNA methylase IME4
MRHPLLVVSLLCLPLWGCNSDNVVAERVTDNNGVVTACGVGDGLSACKSFQGTASNQEMSAEAKQIRSESGKQLEDSIELLENTPANEVDQDQ